MDLGGQAPESSRGGGRTGSSPGQSLAETLDSLSELFASYPNTESSAGGGGVGVGVGGESTSQRRESDRIAPKDGSDLLAWGEIPPLVPGLGYERYNSVREEAGQRQHQPLDLLTGVSPPSPPSPFSPDLTFSAHLADNFSGPETAAHAAWPNIRSNDTRTYGGHFQDVANLDNPRVLPANSPSVVVQNRSDAGSLRSPSQRSAASFDSLFEDIPSPGEIVANTGRPGSSENQYASPRAGSPASNSQSLGIAKSSSDPRSSTTISGVSEFQFQKVDSASKPTFFVEQQSLTHLVSEPGLRQIGVSGPDSVLQPDLCRADSCPPKLPPSQNTSSNLQGSNKGLARAVSDTEFNRTPFVSSSPGIGTPGEDFFFGGSPRGMYKAPIIGAVPPGRPVSLELRPHPLRSDFQGGPSENQVALLSCLGGSVWAAGDQGLMVWWDVEHATKDGSTGTNNEKGDEDAASYELVELNAACMTADIANQVVWTGQRDGTINSWDLSARASDSGKGRAPSLAFEAYEFAVTALTVTSYGDLWAGSERGDMRIWSGAKVAEALSRQGDGASLMEGSRKGLIDVQELSNSIGPLNPEVRFLVEDYAHGMVWCAGALYIAIWDAKTKTPVRLFLGSNGSDLSIVDIMLSAKEALPDDGSKLSYSKFSFKKEKTGWLQRSRNAVMGAADTFRRVATGGADDNKTLKALVAAVDGTMWAGYGNGALVHWDGDGYKQWERIIRPVGVRCLCVVGNRLWVGFADGKLQVIDMDDRKPIESWQAHRFEVSRVAVCRSYVFSLGQNGAIRGWDISYPNRLLDTVLAQAMREKEESFTRQQNIQILAVSWNTAEEMCSLESARCWLAPAASAGIVVVGLQEVEAGAGVLGMAAVKESVGRGLDKGSDAAQGWLKRLDDVVSERKEFQRIASRQLAGMLVGVWVEKNILPYVGDIEVGAVACGFGRTFGNKGAVGVKFLLFRRRICVLTSHLAAHMDQVPRRNADFEHIYSQLSFSRVVVSNAGATFSVQSMLRGGGSNSKRFTSTTETYYTEREFQPNSEVESSSDGTELPDLAGADLLVWTGDLNYRIDHLSYDEIMDLIHQKQWNSLLSKDQLRNEMRNGRTFVGLREGPVKFQPTYKFDKRTDDYDTGEKRRLPAWCDRVLFRDSFGGVVDRSSASKQTLERPCKASVVWYESCMEPKESDHKPVRCMLSVDLAVIDESKRRRAYGLIRNTDPKVRECLEDSNYVPDTSLSTDRLVLKGSAASVLRLTNGSRQFLALFGVYCNRLSNESGCPCGKHGSANSSSGKDHQPKRGLGFPRWLQVRPASGFLKPGDSVSISVRATASLNDEKDLEENVVVLHVNVKGCLSSGYKQHRVCVSYGSAGQIPGRDKGTPRPPSHDHYRLPPSAEKYDQVPPRPRSEGMSHSFTKDTQDLLL